jgi:hypothetical protein
MDSRIEKLMDAFQANGWTFTGVADVSNDWWFTNILHFISTRRPLNTNLYLTLLTDPQVTDKKEVWCVGISSVPPDSKNFIYLDQLTLNDIKKTDLEKFVGKINTTILK